MSTRRCRQYHAGVSDPIIAEAEGWLKRASALHPLQRSALAAVVPGLLAALPAGRPTLIGLGGPPGTGKSTLARLLCAMLEHEGAVGAVVSLDDYYRTRDERASMARSVHPLFAERGAPGTHDLERLQRDLDALVRGEVGKLVLPRFDKSVDDRGTPVPWQGPAPEVVFVEGWCIGCPGGRGLEDAPPVNETERLLDPQGLWWSRVCEFLADQERRLHRRLDQRWLMSPPDWDSVIRWRWRQEQELGQRKRLHDVEAVRTFLATFERLGHQIMAHGEEWADLRIALDASHRPRLHRSAAGHP